MTQATRISATTLARRLGPDAVVGDAVPTYRSLADRIRAAVLDGRLAVGTGLPSERELASGLSLSRTTVGAAYGLLREQGWLDSRRGSGSRLKLPESDLGAGRSEGSASRARATTTFNAGGIFGWQDGVGWNEGPEQPETGPGLIDLTTACLPAPTEPLATAVATAAADLPAYATGDGYLPFGLPVLREVVAARYSAAGVPTTAEQILITSGAQHAFTLVVSTLSDPGDRVLIECPTYPVALDALRAGRRDPVPFGLTAASRTVSGDENVWDTDLFRSTLQQMNPRLGYLIADFQNPTGALMDEHTREAMVASARVGRTMLLVDESFRDVPFPQTAPLPPPMAAFDDGSRVLSLGSVSKCLWGGLRVGWIRSTPALVQRLAQTRALGDMAGPVLDQLVVTALLRDPEPALAQQRARLATGAAALQSALARDLPDWVPTRPAGGTSLWVRLPGPFATELALLAPSVGVRIAPGPRFGPDGTMASYLRLPFGQVPERLAAGVARLATVAGLAAQGARSSLPGWLA